MRPPRGARTARSASVWPPHDPTTRPAITARPKPSLPSDPGCLGGQTGAGRHSYKSRGMRQASGSLAAISRAVSLSLQSAFHLSLTVLVRYRSLADI